MPFTGRYTFSVQVHKGIIALARLAK